MNEALEPGSEEHDHDDDSYVCPGGKRLRPRNRNFATARGDVGQDGFICYRARQKVEMLFAHLKRILKLDRLRLRGPNGAGDKFHMAATAQNLRKMAKLFPMQSQPLPA